MAIYNNDADAVTAVSAFLTQFSISNTGDIRYVAGSDTFHVTWLNRALQHKVWEFTVAGDDDVQLSDPNPSTTAALGQIIRLIDHTASGFAHRYNIDATVASYLFGGSVTQNNASGNEEAWYPLRMDGAAGASVEVQVIQNGAVVTSHWGTGKNQTGTGIINRVLIKAVEDGNLIDGGRVVVWAHDFNFSYSLWEVTLGLTEQSSVVGASSDSFNQTAVATVGAYGISKSEGYNLLDLDGSGVKPYLGAWSYSPESGKSDLYEYVKWILARGEGQTLYGVSSDVWTGRIYAVDIASGSGTWVQNETITWAGGTGNLMGVDDLDGTASTRLWLHLGTGTAPTNTETITGAGAATGVVDTGGSTRVSDSPNHLGDYVGSWLAADGIGFDAAQVTNADSFTDLDGNTVSPPNFVQISGTINCVDAGDDPHVFMTLRSGSSPDYAQHTVNGAQTSGAGTVDINGAIPSTTPQAGWVGLLATGGDNFVFYEYTSWAGSTFTLSGTLGESYADADTLIMAHFYQSAAGGGLVKTVNSTIVYNNTPIDIIGWVRQGDEAAPDAYIPFSGQIGAGGYTFSVDLERET